MIRRLSELVQLGKKHPFCGVCAMLSIFAVIFSLIGWHQLRRLTVLQRKRQSDGEAIIATLNSAPQTRDELAFAKASIQQISNALIIEENLTDNVNYFYNIEGASMAHLDDLRALNVVPSDLGVFYQKIPFSLKVSGTFTEVAAFLQAIETGPRLASINSFSFRKRTGGPLVTADLTLDLLGKNDRK
jgi:Tfp pilus assembly protein PilO